MTDVDEVLRRAAEVLAELDREAGGEFPPRVYDALVQVARRRLPGVGSASVAMWDGRRFTTAAATDEAARTADRLQHERNAGPCVEVLAGAPVSHAPDLSDPGLGDPGLGDSGLSDPGLGDSGPAATAPGFGGALSLSLTAAESVGNGAALNLYSTEPHAFDEQTIQMAMLLTIHARVALAAADGEARAMHLERSRETTQRIGAAVGVLMARRDLGHDEAMDLLRVSSQRSNTRVSELAEKVISTGDLPALNNRGPRSKS